MEYLSTPALITSKDVMLALMDMEIDSYNKVTLTEVPYTNQHGEQQTRTIIELNRSDLEAQLAEWTKVKKELANGDISLAENDEWKTNWPATSEVYSSTSPKQWKKDK